MLQDYLLTLLVTFQIVFQVLEKMAVPDKYQIHTVKSQNSIKYRASGAGSDGPFILVTAESLKETPAS